ncbi:hypothetical protein CP356_09105, partial [Lactobacillus sp. UMNPBX5]
MVKGSVKNSLDESTRVKLYKSGKQWVQCLTTRFSLLNLSSSTQAEVGKQALSDLDKQKISLLKGVLVALAVVGGGAAVAPFVLPPTLTVAAKADTLDHTQALTASSNTTSSLVSSDTMTTNSLSVAFPSASDSFMASRTMSQSESVAALNSIAGQSVGNSKYATTAPVPPVSGQDRASIGSISKETVDLSGTPVYDDFNTWAGYSTNEFGPNKTISVVVTQDANNPNLKHYEITFLPTSRFYNGDGSKYYKMSNARMGFALSKDLTIVGNINFKTYYYLNNADNFKDNKTRDAKVLDKEFLIDHGKLYDAQGHSLSKVFYSDYGAWSNAWNQARRDANYSHAQSLLISNMKYADNATQVHNHFFNDVSVLDGTSPRVSYWGQREVQRQGNGMGMFAESITMNADSNPSTKGQYNQDDFTQAYMWKSWGAWNNTQAGTYTVSFDAISNPDIKAKQTFSGVITAFGTLQGSSYYYGHLTGEEISKVREYKNITVQVEDKFDTKGLENVTMPERKINIGYQKITNEVEGVNGVIYTVENPYDQYKNISDKYPSTVVNTGDTFTHQYSVNVIVPKAGTQVVYLDANQTAPAKTADGKNLMADEYTPEDVAKDTGVTAPEIKGYTLTQTRSFDAKTGTLTVTNNYVRTVPLEELSKEVTDYTTKVKDFLSYVTSDDFFNAWKYNPTDQTVTPPQDSSTAYEKAYKTRLAALNDAAKTLKNDISALDPANYAEYGYQYNSLLDTYTRAVAPFDSSTGTLVKDLSTLFTDLSRTDPQTGKFVLDWSNLPIDGQANGNIYRSNLSDSLSSWMHTIGSKRNPGTIIKGIYDLVDGAENIKTTPRYTEASQPRQAAFDQALKNLKPQLTNVTNFKDLGDYYNLMDSQNKLKEAIYRLDHVTPEESSSTSGSSSISDDGDNGSHNTNPGDNGSHNTNPGDNGSHNTNPGDNGSHNTNPGDNGSHNTNPGDNGSHNTNPGDNGSHNTNPGDNGSHNTNPGDNGSHNTNPGDNGSHNTNPGDNGSHNTNPGDNGSHNT